MLSRGGINGKYLVSSGNVTSNTVSLQNNVALIKIIIPSDMTDIQSVTLRTASGLPLSGNISPWYKNATWFSIQSWNPSVTLKAESGVLEPGEYYLAVIPFDQNRCVFTDQMVLGNTDIIFTNSEGKIARKTIDSDASLWHNTIYTLEFPAGMEMKWRECVKLTLKISDMVSYLKDQKATSEASKLSKNVEFKLDTCAVTLMGYTVENTPEGLKTSNCGWYTKDGKLSNSNRDVKNEKVDEKIYIKLPVKYGKCYLRYFEFGSSSTQRSAALVTDFPYTESASVSSPRSCVTPKYMPVNPNECRLSITRTRSLDNPNLYFCINSKCSNLEGDFVFYFHERLLEDGTAIAPEVPEDSD